MTSFFDDIGKSRDEYFTGEIDLNPFRFNLFASYQIDRVLGGARVSEIDQTLSCLIFMTISVINVDIKYLIVRCVGRANDKCSYRRFSDVEWQVIEPENIGRLTFAESQLEESSSSSRVVVHNR